jgi:putative MATE family efflux protein
MTPRSGDPEHAPLLPGIVRLAVPTTLIGFAQALALTAEMAIVGRLGTEALAAYALVLPFVLLMGMMSTGAMGGGVTSAVARALGAGRREEASALVRHALVIGIGMGLAFLLAIEVCGRAIFAAMGGRDAVLEQATLYARVLFLGVPFIWLVGTLSAVLRGAGNMRLPARVVVLAWLAQPLLGGLLAFGAGPLPELGLAGLGVAYASTLAVAAAVLLVAVRGGAAGFTPRIRGPLRAELYRRILAVGAVASLMAVLANLTTILVTALAGQFGPAAIAAYGIAVRLEFLFVPLTWGIGATLTSLVGHSVGAGDWGRARRLAWTGALFMAAVCGAIGLLIAVFPDLWIRWFSDDPEVVGHARLALRIIAPAYGLLALGMVLYFASQGAGRMRLPLAAAIARVVCAAGGGALAVGPLGLGLAGLFASVALGLLAYASLVAVGVRSALWR